ncbi:unnamed protein product [Bursaphelenchus xylophilus]|uniref:(pine wood nematode) hypothetical protein n=1 Tax=Bursaphelenchus xylophilus TaxID=6326 RepID=A0A1I7S349_BURXY|nr:unnamed protein product [Bursaphelenchus xylophilus]CAG9116095.1 unnamed protein product [Bursaphelenchus xylophilus]
MKDSLLVRPPFKFIHDIVREIVKSTGYLGNVFSADELDYAKASTSKDSKASFLKKLKSNINTDGSLDSVSASKIIAGKEPELTNLLLQKLAVNAAAANVGKPTKQSKTSKTRSSDRDKSKEKKKKPEEKEERKSKKERDREVEREKRRLSKASVILSETGEKEAKSRSKSKERRVRDSKIKKSIRHNDTPIIETPLTRDESTPRRESSGGTSKGDDSGIAEESELHDTARQSRRLSASSTRDVMFVEQPSPSYDIVQEPAPPSPLNEDTTSELKRPTTASGRPQTAMGRPGTAAARPAPPKVKKTKLADIDPVAVNQQPISFEKSTVIVDGEPLKEDEGFLVDEEDTPEAITTSDGTNIKDLTTDSQDHGALINRIIENTRDLEKDGLDVEDMEFDLHEYKKIRLEVEGVQKSLQNSAQTVQPLSRTLEFISEDLTFLIKEVEINRRTATETKQQAVALKSNKNEGVGSYYAQLRNMDDELKDVRSQISKFMAQIIENEKRLNELMINN